MSRTTRSIVRRKARSGSLTVLCLLALMSAAPGSAPRAQSPAAGQDSGSAALLAASEAPVGLSLPVDWSLAGRLPAPDELLVVARPQDPAGTYASRSYPRAHPSLLRLPLAPGDWELRWLQPMPEGPPRVLARRPLHLTDIGVALDPPARVTAGSRIAIRHDGPAYPSDYLTIALPGSADADYAAYNYTARGGPVEVVAPLEPGAYVLRYVGHGMDGDRILGERPLQVLPVTTRLEAAESAPAGSLLQIGWQGPENRRDFIALSRPGAPPESYETYVLAAAGSPAGLVLPLAPGDWELRYVATGDDYVVLDSRPLTILPVSARISADPQARQGARIEISFDGPRNLGDYLAVARPGAEAEEVLSYSYLPDQGTLQLRMPSLPGRYELRYIANGAADEVLARQPIDVLAVASRIEAPDSVPEGAVLELGWQGPGSPEDLLVLSAPHAPPGVWLAETPARPVPDALFATGGMAPARLGLPGGAGPHVLRYLAPGVAPGDPPLVLAERAILLTPVSARLDAPSGADAGAGFDIVWHGPALEGDRIVLARPDDPPGSWLVSRPAMAMAQRTVRMMDPAGSSAGPPDAAAGNLAELQAPVLPGLYALRYLSGDRILAELAFEVRDVSARLWIAAPDADTVPPAQPPSASATPLQGAVLALGWEGPGQPGDMLAVARPGAPASEVLGHAWIRDGASARLRLPTATGPHVLRYLLGGAPEARILAEIPLEITAAAARLVAPAHADAGARLQIGWDGPGHPGDYIAVARPGSEDSEMLDLALLPGEGPATLDLPIAPGRYELRYMLRGDPDLVLARAGIRLDPVRATLDAPAAAATGSMIEIRWTGPAYRGDYLDLVRIRDGAQIGFRYVVVGNPLRLRLPQEPGDYALRYMAGREDTELASRLLRID